jgi:hypothetical protein
MASPEDAGSDTKMISAPALIEHKFENRDIPQHSPTIQKTLIVFNLLDIHNFIRHINLSRGHHETSEKVFSD